MEIVKLIEELVYQQNNTSAESVFGLWKDRAVDKETLRNKAWDKNQNQKPKRKIGLLDGMGDVIFKDNWEMSEEEFSGVK